MSESKGYGEYIKDGPGYWVWTGRLVDTAEKTREAAAELIAWADAHDTVVLVVTRTEAQSLARILGDSVPDVIAAARAARKALGMEP